LLKQAVVSLTKALAPVTDLLPDVWRNRKIRFVTVKK
jgi:hypothetical protein